MSSALGALLHRNRGGRVWLGAMLGFVSSAGGWFAAAVTAALMFPSYPRSGEPSEPIALLFALPGFFTGLAMLVAIARRSPRLEAHAKTEARSCARVAAASLVVAVALVVAHVELTMWPARRALPWTARVTHESALLDAWLPDHEYELSAEMSEAEFLSWVRELGLRPCEGAMRQGAYCRPSEFREGEDGATASYRDGVGHFHSWSS